jgi:lipopolysaccharide biosynthesis glycosyltransferase
MKKILNILTQSDDNYIVPGGVMITSLCENNRHFDELNVYYISAGLSKKSQKSLQELPKKYKNLNLQIIDGKQYTDIATQLNLSTWHGKQITWYKLLAIDSLSINTDRLLYLNPHSIITGSLDYLTQVKFGKNYMLNVYDYFENFPHAFFKNHPQDAYYNCGLMLINYKKWIDDNIGHKIRQSLQKDSNYIAADQGFCNSFFKNQIGILPIEYYYWELLLEYNIKNALIAQRLYNKPNYYSYREVLIAKLTPKIIYFTSIARGRAWFIGSKAPTAPLFDEYLKISPFTHYQRPITHKNLPYLIRSLTPNYLAPFANYLFSILRIIKRRLCRKSKLA